MTKVHFVIEATIRDSADVRSLVNLLDSGGKRYAELNPRHDQDINNRRGTFPGETRHFAKIIQMDAEERRSLECWGDVLKSSIRPATDAEIAANKSVVYWQQTSITSSRTTSGYFATNPAEFRNESGLEFQDVSSEAERVYNFGNKGFVKIPQPLRLNVSDSGGHRIFAADGRSHYVPTGWVQLTWTAKADQPNFVK